MSSSQQLTRKDALLRKNMGTTDRILRTGGAVVVAALYFSGQISGTVAILLGIVATAFFVTSLIGWCPAYAPLGLSTRRATSPSS